MKEIQLTKGQVTIVDDEDYDDLMKYKWFAVYNKNINSYYACRNSRKSDNLVNRKVILMHRYIININSKNDIDHINGNTLDNRTINLRSCTRSQNMMNRGPQINNTSGYKGVFNINNGKWMARIGLNSKYKYLGVFTDKDSAARAYNNASIEMHGEFGYQNIIRSKK